MITTKGLKITSKQGMRKAKGLLIGLFLLIFLCLPAAAQQTAARNPVIIIPGLSGSELVDASGKTVWFALKRAKSDDVRLPISSPVLSRNHDTLKPKDIIRSVDIKLLPDIEVYQAVIDALTAKGYTEASWTSPKAENVFYVFPYDWRRDNVETARLLIQKMVAVRRATRKPNLKFDILAHSMGGLVARYAAMYGTADLPAENVTPTPTWAGAAYVQKLMMFGTPNEGSFNAFDGLLNGSPIVANRKLPLIDDFRAEDVFSCPSVFQLLPHASSAKFLDENLQPIKVDLYDPNIWDKYGWGPLNDPKFLSKLRDASTLALKNKDIKPKELGKDANVDDRLTSQTTYAQARAYFVSALSRAKRFAAAMDVPVKTSPVQFYAFGGNCAPTLAGAVLTYDEKDKKWSTILNDKDIKTKDGREIKKDEVKAAIFALGDGRVTRASLLAATEKITDGKPEYVDALFTPSSSFFACSTHIKLFLDKPIQDSFLSALVVEKTNQP